VAGSLVKKPTAYGCIFRTNMTLAYRNLGNFPETKRLLRYSA